MPEKRRAIFLALCLLACNATKSRATTCADALIQIKGQVLGQLTPNLTLTVVVSPDPRRAMPMLKLKGRDFQLEANFNTFSGEDSVMVEHCGREPESVLLLLKDGNREVARMSFDIRKDFVRDDKTWVYTLRKPLSVEIPPK